MNAIRLQRKRIKGFKLISPNGLSNKYVGRPTIWGNPYSKKELKKYEYYIKELMLKNPNKYLLPLKNNNLICWCNLSSDCHADILLKLINEDLEIKKIKI